MRATLHQLLTGTPGLTAQVPVSRWYQAGNVIDSPPKPFVIIRWLAPVPSDARGKFLRQVRIEHYSARGSYAPSETFLGNPDRNDGVYAVMAGITNLVGPDGRITQADYLGHSGDQEDATYMANLRFSSWQVIGVDL
jgi:hypothetical protein